MPGSRGLSPSASARASRSDESGRAGIHLEDLAGETVDQSGPFRGRTQSAQGDGATVERLEFGTSSRFSNDPASGLSRPTGAPLELRLAVHGCHVFTVKRFG